MKDKIKKIIESKYGKRSIVAIAILLTLCIGIIIGSSVSISLPEGMLVAGTDVIYENDVTGMDSNDVQHAIDELYSEAFENIILYLSAGTGGSFENDTALTNYEGSTTFNVTPSTGHYLEDLTCTGDYTLDTSSFAKGASATAKQTVSITNNGTRKSGVCSATFGTSEYNISLAGTNVTWSPTSTKVSYNSSTTATLTASNGYSITGVTCTNGYTTSINGSTVTINNGGNVGDSTCTASVSANSYTVTLNGSNVSWGNSSLSVSYGGTNSTTLTAATGYSLGTITCTNGYTASRSGSTVTINNNGNADNSTCTASSSKQSYTVTLKSATGGSWGSSSISVPYGGSNTVTITPSSGYKLTSISCTNSYTATYTANSTSAQTVTIKNPTNTSTSTCTPTFASTTYYTYKSSGLLKAKYKCTDGKGTMVECSYNGTVCDGGKGEFYHLKMCTGTGASWPLNYNCYYSLSGSADPGGWPTTITCD